MALWRLTYPDREKVKRYTFMTLPCLVLNILVVRDVGDGISKKVELNQRNLGMELYFWTQILKSNKLSIWIYLIF